MYSHMCTVQYTFFVLETRVRVTCRLTKKSGPESPARARRAPARGGRRPAAARAEDGV